MYLDSVAMMARAARAKTAYLSRSRLSYLVASMLAGAYVGLGIVLIFSIGAPLAGGDSVFLKTLMGAAFGIALTLVVFAGSELFTGNNMVMTIGFLKKEASAADVFKIWLFSWVGNLAGSLALAYLVVASGAISHAAGFIEKISAIKMGMPAMHLFLRGILCNWLVCLALWTSARAQSDAAKCILIFWCLFAFIACAYEHSIANMTLLSLSLFGPHSAAVSWWGFARNLYYVTLGNVVGGAFFVGALYHIATYKEESHAKK